MKLFLLALLLPCYAFGQAGISASYIRMHPTALPAVCNVGDIRVDSSLSELQLCNPANTWTPLSSTVGTVTRVGLTAPTIFSVTGQPVTGSGTIAISFNNESANTFLSGPTTGSSPPTFRLITGNDLPDPASGTLGGIESYAAVTNQWINSISTSGVPSSSQPAFSSISGQVTLGQLPSIASNTVLGNVTGSSATPTAVSQTSLTALINNFTSLLSGAVPASGGGTTNFLRADGNWVSISGSGTVTSVGVTVPSLLAVTGQPITGSGVAAIAWSGLTTNAIPYASNSTTMTQLSPGSNGQIIYIPGVGSAPAYGSFPMPNMASQPANTILAGPAAGSNPAAPTFRALVANDFQATTVKIFNQALYYTFTVSSANATIGATYTNNSQTFTVVYTIAGGTTLVASATGSPSASGTLTKASGTGDSSITFSAEATNGTYISPSNPTPLYLKVRMQGPGGGGGGCGTSGAGVGGVGVATTFNAGAFTAGNGLGGNPGTGTVNGTGGGGGSAMAMSGSIVSIGGGAGGAVGDTSVASNAFAGGPGGSSPFGGAGGMTIGGQATAGTAATTNSGSGGGGANGVINSSFGAGGGGAGAYTEFQIAPGTYTFIVGAGGAAGAAGTSGHAGGPGGSGIIIVEEHYQ